MYQKFKWEVLIAKKEETREKLKRKRNWEKKNWKDEKICGKILGLAQFKKCVKERFWKKTENIKIEWNKYLVRVNGVGWMGTKAGLRDCLGQCKNHLRNSNG